MFFEKYVFKNKKAVAKINDSSPNEKLFVVATHGNIVSKYTANNTPLSASPL